MALTADAFVRPAATSTNNEAITLTAVHIEDTAATPDNVALDFKATVNSVVHLVHRIRTTPEYSGTSGRLKIEYLYFANQGAGNAYVDTKAGDYVDANATTTTVIGYTPWVNLDALYTALGDARS